MSSILPNIVDVALEKGLTVDEKTLGKDEVRFICPWCGDEMNKGRRRIKYHLSLNPNPGKNIFKCWYCHENGGVVDFIAKLEGRTAEDVLERLRKDKGIRQKTSSTASV